MYVHVTYVELSSNPQYVQLDSRHTYVAHISMWPDSRRDHSKTGPETCASHLALLPQMPISWNGRCHRYLRLGMANQTTGTISHVHGNLFYLSLNHVARVLPPL